MAKAKCKVTESHRYMFQCIAKICAYRKVEKFDEAKNWAETLQQHLKKEGLLK